ncbi:nuclear factor 7, brain-like [Amblyraja radiata]|uniref:nuclear factor 7, brain-like n=1 Tax=Amblyraja radiata TaxID=386614 RepID=UPI001403C21C|nr:nuclear factor 7, brain-like [Amblyraja radiata]
MESETFAEELLCAVCLDFFTDPVTLQCGHTFCRPCVTRCWERQRTGSCPVCRRPGPAKDLRGSRALRNLADRARELSRRGAGRRGEAGGQDGTATGHSPQTQPAEDAVGSAIDSLNKARSAALEYKLQQKENISKIKEQCGSLHTLITGEFAAMHQFLTEREQRLLGELREQRRTILGAMQRNLQALDNDLQSIERQLAELKGQVEASRQRRPPGAGAHTVLPLQLTLGQFSGPLQYAAWKAMLAHLWPAPTPLTLDPATAHRRLRLSPDLRSVSHCDIVRHGATPGPLRFEPYVCVLGAAGVGGGRRYWEVEVGGKSKWEVGVVGESADRKGRHHSPVPAAGFWLLWLRKGREYWALERPRCRLWPRRPPRTVGIYLDHEGGQVSFYDADNMAHLYTFTHTFSETLYPYFSPCLNDGGTNSQPLRICAPLGTHWS